MIIQCCSGKVDMVSNKIVVDHYSFPVLLLAVRDSFIFRCQYVEFGTQVTIIWGPNYRYVLYSFSS
jgi:hypothetical protein